MSAPRRRQDGEFELLAKIRASVARLLPTRGVVVGIGDDCAVVRVGQRTAAGRAGKLLLTTDSMIEGVHFQQHWLTARELGVRAFRAAVSDIAAMGAKPHYALLSLGIPGPDAGFGSREALAVTRAVASEASACGATLVGGNVTAADRIGVTVTVTGETSARPLLRRDAKPGDLVFVTGSLGGSAAASRTLLRHDSKSRSQRPAPLPRRASTAWRRPPLRVRFASDLAARGLVRSMIDVSDGLLQDLGHIAAESRVAIRIDTAAVPVHATADLELSLTGGEDYELAFTAPALRRRAIESVARRHRTPVTVIGEVRRGPASVTDSEGRAFAVKAGFDHLRGSAKRATTRS